MRLLLSSGFQTGVTNSFHLINTVRTSTSILTTEVRKLVRAGANDPVLEALYELPPGASGQNLRVFSNQTSTQHEHSLAALWLFTVVGLYEVWTAELPIIDSETGCQFPSKGYNAISRKAGVRAVISALQSSFFLTTVYGAVVASDSRMMNPARLDDALAVHRVFKECRNSLAHAGGAANERVEQWSIDVHERAADLLVDAQGGKAGTTQIYGRRRGIDHIRPDAGLRLPALSGRFHNRRCDPDQYNRRSGNLTALDQSLRQEAFQSSRRKLNRGNWINARFAEIGAPVPPTPVLLIPYLISNNLVREII